MNQTPSPDVALVIGRWQIVHLGHLGLFKHALKSAPKVVIAIGSAFHSRDSRQPFSADERKDMILSMLSPAERDRVEFLPVRDYYDDDRWENAVKTGLASLVPHGARVMLVGHKKDSTTYYLDRFPGWRYEGVAPSVDIDATSLRAMYFGARNRSELGAALQVMSPYVHPAVLDYLRAWSNLPAYGRLVAEFLKIQEDKGRYPGRFHQAADALVRLNDEVLLVQRKGPVGADLWAIPGGFVEPGERFFNAALRELKEETNFSFLASKMRSALAGVATFDHPLRSARGPIISTAHYFAFGAGAWPDDLRFADDAKDLKKVPISELPSMQGQFFEDHENILERFGLLQLP